MADDGKPTAAMASENGHTEAPDHEPGELLHHHIHVLFKSHLDKQGEPRQLEGKLYTILQAGEDHQVQDGIPSSAPTINPGPNPNPRDLSQRLPARSGGHYPGRTPTGEELRPYRFKYRSKRAWLGEIVQTEPTFKAERILLPTDRPLELAEDVNYSKTPQGALRLGLILLAILGIVEWWQLSAIYNSQGLDTGQLTSNWAFFFWGCLIFGGIGLMAVARTKSGRRIEFHCDPRYAEFCAMGNHVGIVGNSRQKSILQQAVDFIGTFDYPTMEALRESLISRDRSQRSLINKLTTANQTVQRDANYGAQSDWAALSRLSRNLNEEVEPPTFSRKKLPDWVYLLGFLAFVALVIIIYPGSGGGG